MKTNSFACSLKSNFYRLSKLKSVWIAHAIMFGLILLSFSIYWVTLNLTPHLHDGGTALALQQATVLIQGRSLLYGSSSTISLGLFVAIITCIFIGNDFSGGYIGIMSAKGTSRATTYFSKWLTLVILSVAYVLFGVLLSGIFYSFVTYETVFTATDFGYLIRNIVLQILSAISLVSIFVMLAFLARSKGSSMAISLLAYILVDTIVNIISAVLLVSDIKNYSNEWTYFMPFMQMDVACTVGKLGTTQIIASVIMPIVYTAISLVIGYFTFEKRDIK